MSNNFKNPWENLNKELDNEENKEQNKNEESDNSLKYEDANLKSIFSNIINDITNGVPQNPKNNNSNNNFDNYNKYINSKYDIENIIGKYFIFVLIFLLFIWLINGVYVIDANQQGVVLLFGKFYKITDPGLNYALPYPIGKVYKLPVTNINKEEFGFRNESKSYRNVDNESLMFTGDENIVDLDYEVQWRIKDAKNFAFSLEHPKATIRMATESAMREIIAKRDIDDALANKKSIIEREVFDLLQEILDSYNSGIEIILVQLLRVDPPAEVINSFRDVQTAKADKERKINEAETYRNDVIPKARGEAEALISTAEGYKKSIISNAEGEVANFLKIYKEYQKNPTLTKTRIYLETMNEIMENVDKVIIDEKVGKNILQHIQLNNSKE